MKTKPVNTPPKVRPRAQLGAQETEKPGRGRPKSSDAKLTRPLRVNSRWDAWQAAVAGSPYSSVNELIEESVERELRRLKSPQAKPRA